MARCASITLTRRWSEFDMARSLIFCLVLLAATAAQAQDLVIPDRARLQAMSQEEYVVYREQIQKKVDGMSAAERNLMRDSSVDGHRQTESRAASGAGYGQGYASRNRQGGHGRGGGRGR